MKPNTKPALASLLEIQELRAALNRRISAINVRINELSLPLNQQTKTLSPVDAAKALLAGRSTTQGEPAELLSQRAELAKLHAALRDTEQPLQTAQTAANSEHCQQFIPAMIARQRKQVELLKAMQQINRESGEMTVEIHRAGFDLSGGLRETSLFVDELEWHLADIEKDVAQHDIANADFGEARFSVRMLSTGTTNGIAHKSGDLLDVPEKIARLAALDGRCDVITPELLRAERTAKIARIAA